MEKLVFKTPTDCLVEYIENNEKLFGICETINNSLTHGDEIKTSFISTIEIVEKLTWGDICILTDIYKRFGWKFTITKNVYHETKETYSLTFELKERTNG